MRAILRSRTLRTNPDLLACNLPSFRLKCTSHGSRGSCHERTTCASVFSRLSDRGHALFAPSIFLGKTFSVNTSPGGTARRIVVWAGFQPAERQRASSFAPSPFLGEEYYPGASPGGTARRIVMQSGFQPAERQRASSFAPSPFLGEEYYPGTSPGGTARRIVMQSGFQPAERQRASSFCSFPFPRGGILPRHLTRRGPP